MNRNHPPDVATLGMSQSTCSKTPVFNWLLFTAAVWYQQISAAEQTTITGKTSKKEVN